MITQVSSKPVIPRWFDATGSLINETRWYEESIGAEIVTRREYRNRFRVVAKIKREYRWRIGYEEYPR